MDNPYPLYAYVFFVVIIMVILMWMAEKLIHMWFERKEKPKKTKVTCPMSGKVLSDFELMAGTCIQCKTTRDCRDRLKKAYHVKS